MGQENMSHGQAWKSWLCANTQATASDLLVSNIFVPQKVPLSKISDDVIACDLCFGSPPNQNFWLRLWVSCSDMESKVVFEICIWEGLNFFKGLLTNISKNFENNSAKKISNLIACWKIFKV